MDSTPPTDPTKPVIVTFDRVRITDTLAQPSSPTEFSEEGKETHSIVVIGRNLVASDTDDHGNSPRTCYRQGHLRDVFHSIPYPVIVQPEGCRHLYALLGPGLHFSFIFPC